MKSKKKLLIVNESLTLAGGEKSLIALLSNLDPAKYDIDLQLFRYGGALDVFIPEYVNILPALAYTDFANKSWKHNFLDLLKGKHFTFFKSKLTYSLKLRHGSHNHPEKAQLYWEAVRDSFLSPQKEYDVGIAYAQGAPTFYVMDKIKAKKKITWLNAKPNFPSQNSVFQKKYYERYDAIVPVSAITYQQIKDLFPDLEPTFKTLVDIVDYQSILKMSDFKNVNFDPSTFNILTVARLNFKSKRFDIALEACKILVEMNINFHWYVLGEGDYRPQMEQYIKDYQLQNYFTLLGTTVNPYPYYKAADLYVQTSELESYGISIAEARLLNVPVVTTRFDTVYVQMIHEKNGLVTDLNAEAVAEAVRRLMNNKELYDSIVDYLKMEQKENTETVALFDQLIEQN